jgi:hypothetical protein
VNKEDYGDKYNEHLLEQYKLFADSIIRLGERRAQTNRFYISILSGLIVIVSFATSGKMFTEFQSILFATVALLGIVLCIIWRLNIQSFGVTSARRYEVLNEMEEKLPFQTYAKAWSLLQPDRKYIPMAKVELFIPFVLLIPYLLLLAYSIYLWVL